MRGHTTGSVIQVDAASSGRCGRFWMTQTRPTPRMSPGALFQRRALRLGEPSRRGNNGGWRSGIGTGHGGHAAFCLPPDRAASFSSMRCLPWCGSVVFASSWDFSCTLDWALDCRLQLHLMPLDWPTGESAPRTCGRACGPRPLRQTVRRHRQQTRQDLARGTCGSYRCRRPRRRSRQLCSHQLCCHHSRRRLASSH